MSLCRRLSAVTMLALLLLAGAGSRGSAHDPSGAPLPVIPGPFTIKGAVLDPQGKPVAGYPLKLLPVLPGKGVDTDNSYYKIPNRDEHDTVTDAAGRFTMTNVVDYEQVKTRAYKLQRGNHDRQYPFVHLYGTDIVALDRLTSNQVYVVIRTEPATTVKILLRDRQGRPYTGDLTISVATGHGRRVVRPISFERGVAVLSVAPGDVRTPGRLVLLPWKTSAEAREQSNKHGQVVEGQGRGLVTYGALAQASVTLLPGQSVTVEMKLEK
ncbi:MAG: hypothetical protein ACM3RP_09230 [Chitinophagales bacterium]